MKNVLSLFSLTYPEIKELAPDFPQYRYTQIFDWIYKKRIFDPNMMTNIPEVIRNILKEKAITDYPAIAEKKTTSDNTVKFLFKLYDGNFIEAVIIDSVKRKTFCLSSQVGCPIKCRFCASGMYGLTRNLDCGEITGQFLLLASFIKDLPDNVVFMGIGEPLLNLKNLKDSLNIICSKEYVNFSQRRITISTSGIPDGIRKLAELNKQYNLAISLHAADDITRAKLIHDSVRFPIKEIIESAMEYFKKTGRLITIEYTLIKNINDSLLQARELADIAKKLRAKINLIPYNPVKGREFTRPENNSCLSFYRKLKDLGIPVTFRLEKGSTINAACGQLRANKISDLNIER